MIDTPSMNDIFVEGAASDNPFIAFYSQMRLAEGARATAVPALSEAAEPLTYRGNDPLTRAIKALARAERRNDPTMPQQYMLAEQIVNRRPKGPPFRRAKRTPLRGEWRLSR